MKTIIIFIFTFLTVNCYSESLWFQENSGTTQDLTKIKGGAGRLWITGKNGTLLFSTTQGISWTVKQTGFSFHFNDISFINALTGFIAGSGGNILKTTDSGNSWSTTTTGTTQNVNAISAGSSRTVAVCSGGIILKTTNYGTSWTQQSVNSFDLKSLTYIYPDYLACGNNGTLIKSTDLGDTWLTLPIATTNDINFIIYRSIDTAFACGLNLLIRTTNGGANWTFLNAGFLDNFTSFAVHPYGYYYLTAFSGKVYRSASAVSGWQLDHTVSAPLNYMNASIPPYGWVVGNSGIVLWPYLEDYWRSFKFIDANNIRTPFSNIGSFNRNLLSAAPGFEYPKGSNLKARYTSGLWLGAVVDGDTLAAVAEFNYEYYPGFTNNSGNPQGKLDTLNRVYRLDVNVNNIDRTKWPNALLGNPDQGAPVYFDALSNSWKPLDYGVQTLYHIMSDSYPESHSSPIGSTQPLKADIKMLNYAFDYPGALNNSILTRYTLINRSSKVWNNLYITLWSDDDLGDATDDMVACDTNLNLAYTYNGDDFDSEYGTAPPAVAFLLLKGPAVYTGNNYDTSWICNANTRINKVGYKDRKMDVFNWYCNTCTPYGDPRVYYETYRMMKGLSRNGNIIINPVTNQPTTYFYSGDPVSGQGWVSGPMMADDQRFISSFGPINMNPGDTQYIVFAQVAARGTSNLNSITVLRQYAQEIKNLYNNCFSGIPIGIEPVSFNIPDRFMLHQNYPNPFNPNTNIRFELPANSHTKLEIIDITGRIIRTLVNEELRPGEYSVNFDAGNLSSGIYFYRIITDRYTETNKMVLIK